MHQDAQNEKIAAFFRVPNVYTNAWLINNPTVIPMVTAIMAPPMSIPLSDAVSPPAWESPDYSTADSITLYGFIEKEKEARTGTRNSTPVTIAVKAVPPNRRE